MLTTPPCKVLPDFHQACCHQRPLVPLSLSHQNPRSGGGGGGALIQTSPSSLWWRRGSQHGLQILNLGNVLQGMMTLILWCGDFFFLVSLQRFTVGSWVVFVLICCVLFSWDFFFFLFLFLFFCFQGFLLGFQEISMGVYKGIDGF